MIDVFSKKAYARPMKRKSTPECITAFKDIIAEGFITKTLDSDNEASFNSKQFRKLCADNNIEQHFVQKEDLRCKGVVERFNSSLRLLIEKYSKSYDTKVWFDVLDKLLENYNTRIHRTIKMSPNIAHENKQETTSEINQIRNDQVDEANDSKSNQQFKVGDKVRILIKKHLLAKKTTQNFSKSIHTITAINGNNYSVSGRKLTYKSNELLPISKVETNPHDREELLSEELLEGAEMKKGFDLETHLKNLKKKDDNNKDNESNNNE